MSFFVPISSGMVPDEELRSFVYAACHLKCSGPLRSVGNVT
jgi:hypothetical protein